MINKRFKLSSNSKERAQVLVYNKDDLQYWKDEAEKTGSLMAFDCYIPEDAMGYPRPPHDIYQIFPAERKQKVHLREPSGKPFRWITN